MEPHPEGGFFRETWRSDLRLAHDLPANYPGERSAATVILFLLPHGSRSHRHRIRSDELWLHQAGDPCSLLIEPTDGPAIEHRLGEPPCFQALVPALAWQSARPLPGPHGYTLVACVVVPGFDFADFELAPGAPA